MVNISVPDLGIFEQGELDKQHSGEIYIYNKKLRKTKKKLFFKMASFAHLFWLHLGLTRGSHCHQSYSNALAFMSAT